MKKRPHYFNLLNQILIFAISIILANCAGSSEGDSQKNDQKRQGSLEIQISEDTISESGKWQISQSSTRDQLFDVKLVKFTIVGDNQSEELTWQVNNPTNLKKELKAGTYSLISTITAEEGTESISISNESNFVIEANKTNTIEFGRNGIIEIPGVEIPRGALTIGVNLYTLSETPPSNGTGFDQAIYGDTLEVDLSAFVDGDETYELEIFKGSHAGFYSFHKEYFDTKLVFEFKPTGNGYYLFKVFNSAKVFLCDAYIRVAPGINIAPVAKIEFENENPVKDEKIILDGSKSNDINIDPLTYAWRITNKPNGSKVVIESPTQNIASMIPDLSGMYTIELSVNDGYEDESRNNDSASVTKRFYVRSSVDEPVVTPVTLYHFNEKSPDTYEFSITLSDYEWSIFQSDPSYPYVYVNFSLMDSSGNIFLLSFYNYPISEDEGNNLKQIYKNILPADLPRTMIVGDVSADDYENILYGDTFMMYKDSYGDFIRHYSKEYF